MVTSSTTATNVDATVATADETLVPGMATIRAGEVVALTAQVFDDFGEPMVGVRETWTSSNESVATVSPSGTVFGHGGEGRAGITASANGQARTSSVHVLPKPAPEPKGKPGPIF